MTRTDVDVNDDVGDGENDDDDKDDVMLLFKKMLLLVNMRKTARRSE